MTARPRLVLAVVAAAIAIWAAAPSIWPSSAAPAAAQQGDTATATFAAGCFWCVEEAFDAVDGVIATISGYTGGHVVNPSYEQVSSGGTGHTEAVEITYDPRKVNYETLLRVFWRNVDPLDARGQFCDKGEQYRSAIFYHSPEQQQLADASLAQVGSRFAKPIATRVLPARSFYAAEEYHQNYYEKHPLRYKFYKWSCGRQQRLEELWGEGTFR